MIQTTCPMPIQQPLLWPRMILLRHLTIHFPTLSSVTPTDSYYPLKTNCGSAPSDKSRAHLITTWYFLLSTTVLGNDTDRCAATTHNTTLSTNQGSMNTATVGSETVLKGNSHCHPPSIKDVGEEQFFLDTTDNSNETPANVVRENLLKAPDSVKSSLPSAHKMILNDHGWDQICANPASSATCRADVNLPLPEKRKLVFSKTDSTL